MKYILIFALFAFTGCCREMNEFNMAKWERRNKFEKHVKSYVKYPHEKKYRIQ